MASNFRTEPDFGTEAGTDSFQVNRQSPPDSPTFEGLGELPNTSLTQSIGSFDEYMKLPTSSLPDASLTEQKSKPTTVETSSSIDDEVAKLMKETEPLIQNVPKPLVTDTQSDVVFQDSAQPSYNELPPSVEELENVDRITNPQKNMSNSLGPRRSTAYGNEHIKYMYGLVSELKRLNPKSAFLSRTPFTKLVLDESMYPHDSLLQKMSDALKKNEADLIWPGPTATENVEKVTYQGEKNGKSVWAFEASSIYFVEPTKFAVRSGKFVAYSGNAYMSQKTFNTYIHVGRIFDSISKNNVFIVREPTSIHNNFPAQPGWNVVRQQVARKTRQEQEAEQMQRETNSERIQREKDAKAKQKKKEQRDDDDDDEDYEEEDQEEESNQDGDDESGDEDGNEDGDDDDDYVKDKKKKAKQVKKPSKRRKSDSNVVKKEKVSKAAADAQGFTPQTLDAIREFLRPGQARKLPFTKFPNT